MESFAANCNTVISFYCTDPATQEMARLHDPDVLLNDLELNYAFVVRYDKNERRHVHGIETMNWEYREFKAKMESAADAASVGCRPGGESLLAQKSLYDIVDELEHPEPQTRSAVSAKEEQKMELRENASGSESIGRIRLERNYV